MTIPTTVDDNGVEVIFEFENATIQVGDSNIDTLLGAKADKKAIDSQGKVWFTTDANASPNTALDSGGMGSTYVWTKIGTIALGEKTLYVWECVLST